MAMLTGVLVVSGCAGLPAPPAAAPAAPASAAAGGATIVAVAPPSPPAVTLPQFLGLDVAYGGITTIGQRVRNRLGTRFPGLESRPPVRSLTDPANLDETASPAVQAAAEAKAEQDAVPQKAKAVRFLATLGCGKCFPDTENALLAALEDCNELIRYEAVRGLRKSLGTACHSCRQNSCCTPRLTQKLYQLGYGVDEQGCYIETSPRVRRNARLALCGCGGLVPEDLPFLPIEGPVPVSTPASESGEAPEAMAVQDGSATESTDNPALASQAVGGGLALTEQVSSLSVPLVDPEITPRDTAASSAFSLPFEGTEFPANAPSSGDPGSITQMPDPSAARRE